MTKLETLQRLEARIRFFQARMDALKDEDVPKFCADLEAAHIGGALAALQWALVLLTRGDADGLS